MGIQVISFYCHLKNKTGQTISSTYNRDVLTGSLEKDPMLRGLASGLQNLKSGEKRTISLVAEDAYGLYDPNKVILYPRKKLPKTLRVGEMICIVDKNGRARSYKLLEFHSDMASLDENHPLAGQDLIFEIEALDVREATVDEIADASHEVSKIVFH